MQAEAARQYDYSARRLQSKRWDSCVRCNGYRRPIATTVKKGERRAPYKSHASLRSTGWPQMLVREVEVLLPIVRGHVMLAAADVIADCPVRGLVHPRHVVRGQPFLAE